MVWTRPTTKPLYMQHMVIQWSKHIGFTMVWTRDILNTSLSSWAEWQLRSRFGQFAYNFRTKTLTRGQILQNTEIVGISGQKRGFAAPFGWIPFKFQWFWCDFLTFCGRFVVIDLECQRNQCMCNIWWTNGRKPLDLQWFGRVRPHNHCICNIGWYNGRTAFGFTMVWTFPDTQPLYM